MVQRRKMRLDHPDSQYVFTIFQYSNFMTANRAFFSLWSLRPARRRKCHGQLEQFENYL